MSYISTGEQGVDSEGDGRGQIAVVYGSDVAGGQVGGAWPCDT